MSFVLKVASRCNLNCTYCYVYNKGDETWRGRPRVMPQHVFEAAMGRIRRYCEASGQEEVHLVFHGGEPALAGPGRLGAWCAAARQALDGVARVDFAIQTNGTVIDLALAEVFRQYDVEVGISIDGPKELHDAYRITHAGRGSYDRVFSGIELLKSQGVPFGVLAVVQLGANPVEIHRHLVGLGPQSINYLLPDFSHDTVAPVHDEFGPTPCADFLLPILDDWWSNGTVGLTITLFRNVARLILGGASRLDAFGNRPFRFLFIEADGSLEGLDVLRVCREGIADTGLNVLRNDIVEIVDVNELHRAAIFDGMPLPSGCRGCSEELTCGGGYLPHRYSAANEFDNPSVWCADILALFGRLRHLLGVDGAETAARRRVLVEMGARRELLADIDPALGVQ